MGMNDVGGVRRTDTEYQTKFPHVAFLLNRISQEKIGC